MNTQSRTPSGSTSKTSARAGTLVINTWTTAVVPTIARNVRLARMLWKPLVSGVSDRQLISFHTWKNTYTAKKMLTCRVVNPNFGLTDPSPANQRPYSIPASSAIITTMKKTAVERIVFIIAGVRMFSSLRLGGRFITPARGGSEHSAIEANVSMMTLIHNSCRTVKGGRTPKNGPRKAIVRALTLMVNWN